MKVRAPYKVMAMHDMCAYGRSSLTAATPVLSVYNCQVCPLPTALLSTHFGFPSPTLLNLSDELKKILVHWRSLELRFDCFYSGYLASPDQVRIAFDYIDAFNPRFIYVDPVLGDDGELYPGFGKDQVDAMRDLVHRAHAISPNLTEACALLDCTPVKNITLSEARKMLSALRDLGPDQVCITGVPSPDGKTITIYGYDGPEDKSYAVSTPRVDRPSKSLHGTGDAFAAALVGQLLDGKPYVKALNTAATYLYLAAKMADEYGLELCLEPHLSGLMAGDASATVDTL